MRQAKSIKLRWISLGRHWHHHNPSGSSLARRRKYKIGIKCNNKKKTGLAKTVSIGYQGVIEPTLSNSLSLSLSLSFYPFYIDNINRIYILYYIIYILYINIFLYFFFSVGVRLTVDEWMGKLVLLLPLRLLLLSMPIDLGLHTRTNGGYKRKERHSHRGNQ